ncbi:MAG: DUF4389 domain-containing protein [Solirubrobacterales bacterium]
MQPSEYPVALSIEYPDRPLNRLSTALRIFAAIPILILLELLQGANFGGGVGGGRAVFSGAEAGAGIVVLPTALMIIFRKKYPRWWFDWNRELLRFINRVGIYLALMDDRYPSTEDQQALHLDFSYPDVATDLNRGLPIVKWLLAIPHYLVLILLYLGAFFAVIGAWFAILFTGRYPRGIFGYLEGVFRWHNRVIGYAVTLVTDRYPPFRLSA